MEISILGSLALAHEGRCHAIASRRLRSILALLALAPGTPVPFDQLVDQLWSGGKVGNPRNALQANVMRLRKLLDSTGDRPGDQVVRTTDTGYQLDLPPEAIDAHLFLALSDRAAGLLAERPAEAIILLERALGLWKGPALFDVPDGTRRQLEAARLEERRLAAREDLITAKLAVGQERGVVTELQLLAAQHPERERLSEQLMLALYRDGRQSEALGVFHDTRRRLASELGLEPGRSMHRLYQAILEQDRLLG